MTGRQFVALVALASAWSAALVQPGHAATIHQLVFTENSDTSLSVTFDGSTLGINVTLNGSGDSWTVDTNLFFLDVPTEVSWTEPSSSLFNNVSSSSQTTSTFLVTSDRTTGASGPALDGTGVAFGTEAGAAVQATFNDIGDTAAVPEPASLALLGTALLGFGVARRRRRGCV